MQTPNRPQENEFNPIPADESQTPDDIRQKAEKKLSKITIRWVVLLSILNIIAFGVLLFNLVKQEDITTQMRGSMLDSLKYMSQYLEFPPIMEILIMDSGSTCPSGLEREALIYWPGTVNGCLCENGDLYSSKCHNVTSKNCRTEVKSTEGDYMYIWEDSIWCRKRAVLGTNYLRQAECPPEYKECYPGGCFIGECPITKLEITSTGTANKFNGKDKYLGVTKTQGEFPLINLRISLDDLPCFSQKSYDEVILKSSTYPLTDFKENKCNQYGLNSIFSTRLDSQTAYETFIQNSFTNSTMQLPYFEENANSTISVLSAMFRMKTAHHDFCLNIDWSPFTASWDYFYGRCYIFFAIFLCVAQAWSVISFLPQILKQKSLKDNSNCLKCLFETSYFIYIVLLPIGIAWYFATYQPFKTLKDIIERYDSLKCFEGGQGSLVISDYLEVLKNFEVGFWAHYGIVVFAVLSIWVSIWYFKERRRIKRMNVFY